MWHNIMQRCRLKESPLGVWWEILVTRTTPGLDLRVLPPVSLGYPRLLWPILGLYEAVHGEYRPPPARTAACAGVGPGDSDGAGISV